MQTKVSFCYKCGRPVGPLATKCIYCAAPTRRIIRPDRRCPFCDEPIRYKALKCVHCGEFLDGRPREREKIGAKAQQQPTFIIERAVFTGGQGLPGPAGTALPGGSSRLLEAGSPSIAASARALPPAPPLALPSPSDPEDDDPLPVVGESTSKNMLGDVTAQAASGGEEDILDVEAGPPAQLPAIVERSLSVPNRNELAIVGTQADNLPEKPPVPPLPPAVVSIFNFFKRVFGPKPPSDDSLVVEAQNEEDKYRTCGMCQTEILSSDSFCYHCGQQYAIQPGAWNQSRPRAPEKSNAFLYLLVMLALGAYVLAGEIVKALERPDILTTLRLGTGIGAPFLALCALLRKSGFFSRLFALVVLLASLAIVLLFYSP